MTEQDAEAVLDSEIAALWDRPQSNTALAAVYGPGFLDRKRAWGRASGKRHHARHREERNAANKVRMRQQRAKGAAMKAEIEIAGIADWNRYRQELQRMSLTDFAADMIRNTAFVKLVIFEREEAFSLPMCELHLKRAAKPESYIEIGKWLVKVSEYFIKCSENPLVYGFTVGSWLNRK